MKNVIVLMCVLPFLVFSEVHDVAISNFKFTPNDLTISVGDTVRWTNTQGFHDVNEDNDAFSSGAASSSAFVFEQTFNSIEEVLYYCSVHSSPGQDIDTSMNGKITVIEALAETFNINQGISGAWFFPTTAGSGFVIDIRPSDNFFFAAWFTYDTQSNEKIGSIDNRWFTVQGSYTEGSAMNLPLFHTSGGIFDNSQTADTAQIGTVSFVFDSCNSGNVTYNITQDSLSGTFPIQRVLSGTESLCEDLDALVE